MSKKVILSPIFVWFFVIMALNVLAYALLVRPYHMRWGASAAEMAMPLPGDHYITEQTIFSTRAITIHAPAKRVWEWVIRLGQNRNGFYSYDWLENIFAANMPDIDRLLPETEIEDIGERIFYMENGPSDEISYLEAEKTMIIGAGWTFHLLPEDDVTTRLIVRYPTQVGESLFDAVYYYAIWEEVHFVMESGMMMGIKMRAENEIHSSEYQRFEQPGSYIGWSAL